MKDPTLSNILLNMRISSEVILSDQFESEEEPFAEYLWMEHEEEFNREVEEQLWEEEFIERCFRELLEEEEEEEQWEKEFIERCIQEEEDLPSQTPTQLQDQISLLVLDADADLDVVINSSLNPNAKEFIPGIQKHIV